LNSLSDFAPHAFSLILLAMKNAGRLSLKAFSEKLKDQLNSLPAGQLRNVIRPEVGIQKRAQRSAGSGS